MAKKHDERKDLRSVSRIARINGNHIIIGDKSAVGIHTWGKIDFLTKYCGYVANYEHGVKASNLKFDEANTSAREAKRIRKEHKLTNKKK